MSEQKTVKTTKRNANMELLRIISMLMVVVLHALGKGESLGDMAFGCGANPVIAWILEMLCISAVNIFMLISGYFLCESKFRLGRLLDIVFQVVFYSVAVLVVFKLLGIGEVANYGIYEYLICCLPIHMDEYWFLTSYVAIYLMLPLIQKAVHAMTKKQFKGVLALLLIFESLFKTILPVRLEIDQKGYGYFWFLLVFLTGCYFRMYGFKHLTTSIRGFLTYFCSVFAGFLILYGIQHINDYKGSLSEIRNVSMEYNHFLVYLMAIGIFAAFLNAKPLKEGIGKVICTISPMSLGVYLLHEAYPIRYEWHKWLKVYQILPLPTWKFVAHIAFAVLAVYVIGTCVDFVRIKLFKAVGKVVDKTPLRAKINRFDLGMNGSEENN